MKKRNFITGFSAAFVATIALVSCGGIRSKDGVVLTIDGEEYTAEKLYEGQQTPAAAEAKFNAVYKVAIRRYFQQGQPGYDYMTDITRDTKNKIAGAKAEAQSNADKNGTKYDAEWDKILSNNGVDDEAGLYDKFEYDLQKSKFDDTLYERRFNGTAGEKGGCNYDILRNGGYLKNPNGEDIDISTPGGSKNKLKGYLSNKMPYHIKHILVKISAKDGDDVAGEITSEEAGKICDVITALASGESFDKVASSILNDDESARKNHGSLGIMSRDTSFVNDFKLGTYLFDAFYSNLTSKSKDEWTSTDTHYKYSTKKAKTELFEAGSEAEDCANKISELSDPTAYNSTGAKLGRIPYGVIEDLNRKTNDNCKLYQMDLTNSDTSKRFTGVTNVKAKYYPRNIIFNKYFNKHNLMLITDAALQTSFDYDDTTGKYIKKDSTSGSLIKGDEDDLYISDSSVTTTPSGFKAANELKNQDNLSSFVRSGEKILCDDNGRPILVFRSGNASSSTSNDSSGSYQGIHFVVLERSPFVGTEFDDNDITQTGSNKFTNLDEYYTHYFPGQPGGDYHPKYNSTTTYKETYISYAYEGEELSKLKERANTVKSELKKADDNLNTYVYQYLVKLGKISFNKSSTVASKLEGEINNWINTTKRLDGEKQLKKNWDETWSKHLDSLTVRNENRSYVDGKGLKIAPEILVKVFEGTKQLQYKDKDGNVITCTLNNVFGEGGAYND